MAIVKRKPSYFFISTPMGKSNIGFNIAYCIQYAKIVKKSINLQKKLFCCLNLQGAIKLLHLRRKAVESIYNGLQSYCWIGKHI